MRNKTDKLLIAVLCCFFVIIVLTAIQKTEATLTNIKYEVAQQEKYFQDGQYKVLSSRVKNICNSAVQGTIVPLVSDGEKKCRCSGICKKVFIGEAEADRYIMSCN